MIRKTYEHISAGLIFCAAVALLRCGLLPLFSTHYLGGVERDAGLYVWLARSFRENPISSLFFSAPAFYPYDLVRAWSDTFILPSCLFTLLSIAGASDATAYNIVILLASILNGYSCYVLVRALQGSFLSAISAGICFLSLPYLTTHLGHPQLQFAFFIPLSIMLALAATTSPSFARWFAVALNVSCAFLTAANYAVICVLVTAFIVFLRLVNGPSSIRGLCKVPVVLGFFVGLVPGLPVLIAHTFVSAAFDKRKLYEAYAFQVKPLSYLSHAPLHILWGKTSELSSSSEGWLGFGACLGLLLCFWAMQNITKEWKSFSLLGLSFVLLSFDFFPDLVKVGAAWLPIISAIIFIRNKNFPEPLTIIMAIGCIFFSLSCGPVVDPTNTDLSFSPFSVLYYVFPGCSSIRAVGRFGIVPLLCICIVPFVSLRKCGGVLLVLLSCLILFENTYEPYARESLVPSPRIFEALKTTIKSNEAVIVLPLSGELKDRQIKSWSEYAFLNIRAMNWGVDASLKNLVNGYSGQRPRLFERLPFEVRNFPDARSLSELSQVGGLSYIVWLPTIPEIDVSHFDSEYVSLVAGNSEQGFLFKFKPHISVGSQPNYVLLPHQAKTFRAHMRSSGKGCSLRFGLAEHTEKEALEEAFRTSPLVISKTSLDDGNVELALPSQMYPLLLYPAVRPTILAIDSSCKAVLDLSPTY